MSNTFLEISACCDSWFLSRQPYGFLCPAILPLPFFAGRGSARFLYGQTTLVVCAHRSDNCAAVLRLQNTQPKDLRIYTTLTGILTELRPAQNEWQGRNCRTEKPIGLTAQEP